MTWSSGVPQERRSEFVAELQRRLDADRIPCRVGKARHPAWLVFRCLVRGRGRHARRARSEAFEHCSIHEQLLRLEMFGEQPCYLTILHALAFLAAILLARRMSPACSPEAAPVPHA
jgi:hypothetical protein